MLSLTYIVVFIFCLSIAAAAILIGHRFISTYNTTFNQNYFYFLVTFYAFAFYGIWGQILVREALAVWNTEAKVIVAVAGFLPILGIPFLFISWIMLIKMAFALFDQNVKNIWLILHGILLVIVLVAVWIFFTFSEPNQWLDRGQLVLIEIIVLLILEAVYFLCFTLIVVYKLKKHPKPINRFIYQFVIWMGLGMAIRESLLCFIMENPWITAVTILLYFASNFIPLFYLQLKAEQVFKPLGADQTDPEKMEYIFKKYKISKREKDIVEQICAGKTNRQIADELFISLQTVKDHTHRIYTKMGINSRMKLLYMVRS